MLRCVSKRPLVSSHRLNDTIPYIFHIRPYLHLPGVYTTLTEYLHFLNVAFLLRLSSFCWKMTHNLLYQTVMKVAAHFRDNIILIFRILPIDNGHCIGYSINPTISSIGLLLHKIKRYFTHEFAQKRSIYGGCPD